MEDDKDPVTMELCKAYRIALEEKIKALKNSIILGLSISTTIIVITQYILLLARG
jgi:hypothetical protein